MAKRQIAAGEELSLYANTVAIAIASGSASVSDNTLAVTSTGAPVTVVVGSTGFVVTAPTTVVVATESGAAHFGTDSSTTVLTSAVPESSILAYGMGASATASGVAHFGTASSTTILTSAVPQSSILGYGMGGSATAEDASTTVISSTFLSLFNFRFHLLSPFPSSPTVPSSDPKTNNPDSHLHRRLPHRIDRPHHNRHNHSLRLHRPWCHHRLGTYYPHDDCHEGLYRLC